MRYDSSRLFAMMDAQGRRDGWLAEQVGVSKSLVSRIRSGERFADERFAERAARVLQVPLRLLFLPIASQNCDDLAQDRVAN